MWIYRKESQADGGSCHPRRSSSALFFFLFSSFLRARVFYSQVARIHPPLSLPLTLCAQQLHCANILGTERERTGCGKKRKKKTIGRGQRMSCLLVCLMGWRRSWTGSGREKEGDMAKHVAYCENLTQRIAERTGDVSRDLEQRRRYQCTDTRDALFSLFLLSTHRQTLQTKTDSEWLEQSARLPSLPRHPLIS